MLIIPAIDILEGNVVRLVQGERDRTIYSRDPVKTAKHWVRQGAPWLHVVDLDGAFSGEPKNLGVVKEICKAVPVPVEFGGGVRSSAAIAKALGSGVSRVVLGTRAAEDQAFLKKVRAAYKDRVIVSVDAREGVVVTKGWKKKSKLTSLEFALALKEAGFKEMIYTDVSKDGMLKGPNTLELKKLLKAAGIRIIASGGIASLEDVRRLKLLEKQGVSGVIIGKALYEARFTLSEVLKLS